MRFHVITIFPESLDSYIHESIIGRAIREKKIDVRFYNPRDFVVVGKSQKDKDKPYLRVDDKPYGGGPGMVMEALPILKAVALAEKKLKNKKLKPKIIHFSPSGKKFTTAYAKTTAKKYADVILICGRYEGIDSRVDKILKTELVSIGDYVLTGGELPAMVVLDSIARQIPGVLGTFASLEEERISSSQFYTRPEVLLYKGKKYRVPKVLLSGNHKKINEWRESKKK
ncbi:MAG: tRNA (guanosine(37)-N1)-methyltransferase TrmD [Candidatus Pacebacteria bacterium]|jgi:tRNA (guanine37-N1)-methyltransferase|nr:tRNA (guanosine(37)-N1)-methyltransferase TrmD [Candidatus Paceibacterota bacterium]